MNLLVVRCHGFDKLGKLKENPNRSNHVWVRGYNVDTIGVVSEIFINYV